MFLEQRPIIPPPHPLISPVLALTSDHTMYYPWHLTHSYFLPLLNNFFIKSSMSLQKSLPSLLNLCRYEIELFLINRKDWGKCMKTLWYSVYNWNSLGREGGKQSRREREKEKWRGEIEIKENWRRERETSPTHKSWGRYWDWIRSQKNTIVKSQ